MQMSEADFMSALHGYIAEVTGLDSGRIFQGNQSRIILPKTGEYCVYTPIIRRRRGTNVYNFDAAGVDDDTNGTDTMTALILIDVQVDFYDENAMIHAQALEIASKSYFGTDYFKQKNLDVRVCSAENPRNLTGIDASNQFEARWSVTITAEVNSQLSQGLPWFEDVNLQVFKNVDVSFPPTE